MKLDPVRSKKRNETIAAVKGSVAAILRNFPSISKIWLVGSIARPLFFDLRSDVDVVVDGVRKERYFELYNFIEKRLETKIDLILYGDVEGEDKRMFDNKVVIYEKNSLRGKTNIKGRNRLLSEKDRRT